MINGFILYRIDIGMHVMLLIQMTVCLFNDEGNFIANNLKDARISCGVYIFEIGTHILLVSVSTV